MPQRLRQLENIQNVDYNPDKKTIFYAEDQNIQNDILQKNQDIGLTLDPFGSRLSDFSFKLRTDRAVFENNRWQSSSEVNLQLNNTTFYINGPMRRLFLDSVIAWFSRYESTSADLPYINYHLKTSGTLSASSATFYMRIRIDGYIAQTVEFDFDSEETFNGSLEIARAEFEKIKNGAPVVISLGGKAGNPNTRVYFKYEVPVDVY